MKTTAIPCGILVKAKAVNCNKQHTKHAHQKQILEAIDAMPEEQFTHIDAVIEELVLLEKIERGLEAIRNGQVISEEEIDKEIDSW